MAFVRILPMNLLFRGPLRVFFGAPAGSVFGFLFCAAGGIVPAALMAPGAGALWLWMQEEPDRNDRKKEGAAEMPLLLRYGGNFPVGRDGPQGRPPPSPGEGGGRGGRRPPVSAGPKRPAGRTGALHGLSKAAFPLLHRHWPKKCFDLAGEYDIIYR